MVDEPCLNESLETQCFPTDTDIIDHFLNPANALLAPYFELVPVYSCGDFLAFRPNHLETTMTPSNESMLKQISGLDPRYYLNVWIINEIETVTGGTANGFTYNPARHNIKIDTDGIVVKSLADATTLVHEIGHYFGLYHLWGPDEEEPENCAISSCDTGDFIEDTAPHLRSFNALPNEGCPDADNFSEGIQEEFFCLDTNPQGEDCRNMMGYGGIERDKLTEGQFHRMIRFKNENVHRTSLGDGLYGNSLAIEYSSSFTVYNNINADLITIKSGSSVTMKSNTIFIKEGGKIILEPGSRLILEGATITTCSYDKRWKGIFMHQGNKPQDPYGDLSQSNAPICIVKNNSKITGSEYGITNVAGEWLLNYGWNTNDWNGVLIAKESQFLFNNIAINFFNQNESGLEVSSNCIFQFNDIAIKTLNVKNYKVSNSTFEHSNEAIINKKSELVEIHIL